MQQINLKNNLGQEGNHFVAQCQNVDVSSFGDTRGEALANLQEALELYFGDALKVAFAFALRSMLPTSLPQS